MGLSWQQGPLSPGAIGRFLVPEPLPKRLLYFMQATKCQCDRRIEVRAGLLPPWRKNDQDDGCAHSPAHQHPPHGVVAQVSLERRSWVPQQSREGAGRER
jgi:hypothetical protein